MIQKKIFFLFIALAAYACLSTEKALGMQTDLTSLLQESLKPSTESNANTETSTIEKLQAALTTAQKDLSATMREYNAIKGLFTERTEALKKQQCALNTMTNEYITTKHKLTSTQAELNTKTQKLQNTQDIASQKTTELQQKELALKSAKDNYTTIEQQLKQSEALNTQQETTLNTTQVKLNSTEAEKGTLEKKIEDQKKHTDSAYFKFNSNNIGKNLNLQNQQLYDAGYAAAINITMEQIYIPYAAERHFIDTQQKDDIITTLRSNTTLHMCAAAYGLGQDEIQTTQNPGLALLYATGNSLWFTSHNLGLRILGHKIANTEIGKKVIAASGYKNLSPALQTTLEEASLLLATVGIQILEVKTFGNKKHN